jgi:hypothetical protein
MQGRLETVARFGGGGVRPGPESCQSRFPVREGVFTNLRPTTLHPGGLRLLLLSHYWWYLSIKITTSGGYITEILENNQIFYCK